MKLLCFGLLALSCCFMLGAQTNPTAATAETPAASATVSTNELAATNGPTTTNAPATLPPPIHILGDKLFVEIKSNIAVYTGHAGIDHPDMQVRCEVLRIEAPGLTASNYNRVTAESNVVIDYWKTNHATADKAVVTKTLSNGVPNILVQLIGNACVTSPRGSITGASLVVWDPIKDRVEATGGSTTVPSGGSDFGSAFGSPFQTKTNASGSKTNSPAHKTNSPPIRPQLH
jgi:lipopolysaccharide export system protein LptA